MNLNEAFECYRSVRTSDNLSVLYPLLKERVTRIVGKVRHEEPDDDLVSEAVLLIVYQRIENYNPERSAPSTWVEGVVRDFCSDSWRKQYRNPEESLEGLPPSVANTLFSKDDPEKSLLITECFRDLTEEESKLLMGKMEGYSGAELAESLEVSEEVVWKRWERLRKKLCQVLPVSNG